MKVLVTGAKGFIGKNLITELEQRENVEVSIRKNLWKGILALPLPW